MKASLWGPCLRGRHGRGGWSCPCMGQALLFELGAAFKCIRANRSSLRQHTSASFYDANLFKGTFSEESYSKYNAAWHLYRGQCKATLKGSALYCNHRDWQLDYLQLTATPPIPISSSAHKRGALPTTIAQPSRTHPGWHKPSAGHAGCKLWTVYLFPILLQALLLPGGASLE